LPLASHPPAHPQLSPLSLHDALPISRRATPLCGATRTQIRRLELYSAGMRPTKMRTAASRRIGAPGFEASSNTLYCLRPVNETRSEEHTSELQSPDHLVCRLLLEKKK